MEFNLLGQKIVIKDQGEANLASQAIAIANEKISEIQAERPMLGPQQIAILALMEVAGSLVKDRQMIDQYREELDRKCSALMREISSVARLERPTT